MNSPKVYLISRKLTTDQFERIVSALKITPLSAAVVCDPRDVELAKQFCETAQTLQRPIAIVAEFDFPFLALNEDGSLCPPL